MSDKGKKMFLKTYNHLHLAVEEIGMGRRKVRLETTEDDIFIPVKECETEYPVELIARLLEVRGGYLCDEILREESPDYVQRKLHYNLLSYLPEDRFSEKLILDFGCGSGASTLILKRMFPKARIIGFDHDKELISLSLARLDYYKYKNVDFFFSEESDQLFSRFGPFDYIVLSAVWEHILPKERKTLLLKIWRNLTKGGILFINQTPNRAFPLEVHTTGGLPFINYLPDRCAFFCSRHFSRRGLKNRDWDTLLKMGIRGGSIREIMKILSKEEEKPVLLTPERSGMKDRIDLWRAEYSGLRLKWIKNIFIFAIRIFKAMTGVILLPHLSLAVKKREDFNKVEY